MTLAEQGRQGRARRGEGRRENGEKHHSLAIASSIML
jgi:hypothetical protein